MERRSGLRLNPSRPEVGKTVTYDLAKDDRGRPRATQIRYAGTAKPPPVASPPLRSSLTQAIVGASVFLAGIVVLVVTSRDLVPGRILVGDAGQRRCARVLHRLRL